MMQILRPLPPAVTRPFTILVLLAWAATMGVLVARSYGSASGDLATDLARYGAAAHWRGVYYRGDKIGFTVSQIRPIDDGFELQEDGRLQMTLLGATTAAKIRTTARVDASLRLRGFEFALDPGTGAVEVRGTIDGRDLALSITSRSGTRREVRVLAEPPIIPLNLSRRLAREGLKPGARYRWAIFDPATLQNAPVHLEVGRREVVAVGRNLEDRVPAFRVELEFAGLRTTSWITDTGEVVREESPTGLLVVREAPADAMRLAVPFRVRRDMLASAAVVPAYRNGGAPGFPGPGGPRARMIDEPRDVRHLRLRLEGADLSGPDLQGAGQTVRGNLIEIVDPRTLQAGPADPDAARYLLPEPLIESDAAEIRDEALRAVQGIDGVRGRAERLVRHVNALLEKKPTVTLPSALEVLRTRIGDCNEHTVLYVAMARSLGIPARIAVGLAHVRGAFYYHAWPEVFLDEGGGRGLWLPVDPTFNQFPADATHVRLARGGLDKQAAILPLIGRLAMSDVEVELTRTTPPGPGTPEPRNPDTLESRNLAPGPARAASWPIALPARTGSCWSGR